jgi:hypothetical protein
VAADCASISNERFLKRVYLFDLQQKLNKNKVYKNLTDNF